MSVRVVSFTVYLIVSNVCEIGHSVTTYLIVNDILEIGEFHYLPIISKCPSDWSVSLPT